MKLNQDILSSIYGTIDNLEEKCISSKQCWEHFSQFKLKDSQYTYLPYVGAEYKNILFCGINLNGGNNELNAINILVDGAINDLKNKKYKIFKQKGYGGSSFYYYVPLISFLFKKYFIDNVQFHNETNISWEEKIEGYKYCALTNIVKCSVNSNDKRSTPNNKMLLNCIPKFIEELKYFEYKVLFFFTYFKYPTLTDTYFSHFKVIKNSDRYRIKSCEGKWIVELEHPLSTRITRIKKFNEYKSAVYELCNSMKSNNLL
ncbi:MAG: hypothetical protein KJ963_04475 [Bacteroidetes bacterium]|nr:hypothetical protein [Bacteroidota bacterium]MBU1422166.1 hypothetical protein [Bacteroidota bacterium]MBU2636324.1 hypothetical protein [Bacteroidota bacterium]